MVGLPSRNLSVFLILVLVNTVTANSQSESEVEAALQGDDQCVVVDGNVPDCALNALQMKRARSQALLEADAMLDEEEESEWAKDITVEMKDRFKAELVVLQDPLMDIYGNLSELEEHVNGTMEEVENATGEPVIWNNKVLLQMDDMDDPVAPAAPASTPDAPASTVPDAPATPASTPATPDASSPDGSDADAPVKKSKGGGRRRRHMKLPPRARYIRKILTYLDKEMKAAWDLRTIVDRKRFGILNSVISHPYGPKGRPLVELIQQEEEGESYKPKAPKVEHVITNKYEKELQDDYDALLIEMDDARNKTEELRASIAQTTVKTQLWLQKG